MCGLSAIYGKRLLARDIDVFRHLMTVSNLRGASGAGMISVNDKNEVFKCRQPAWNGVDLVSSVAYEDMVKDKHGVSLLIGHTRWPTKGGTTLDNTHPHDTNSIIGVHNGTLELLCGEPIKHGASDSKALFQSISDIGIEETFKKTYGAYALMYVDKDKDTFNVIRNDKRTLYVCWALDYKDATNARAIYFASEEIFLHFACRRAGVLWYEIKPVPENVLWTFPTTPEKWAIAPPEERPLHSAKGYWEASNRPFVPKTTETNGKDGATKFLPPPFRNGDNNMVLLARATEVVAKRFTDHLVTYIFDNKATATVMKSFADGNNTMPRDVSPRIMKMIRKFNRQSARRDILEAKATDDIPPEILKQLEIDLLDEQLNNPPLDGLVEIQPNRMVNMAMYQRLLKGGCAWCSEIPDPNAYKKPETAPRFINHTDFLCADCKDKPDCLSYVQHQGHA